MRKLALLSLFPIVALCTSSCESDPDPSRPASHGAGGSGGVPATGGGGGQLDRIDLEGLSAPVRVAVDTHGMKHLSCATDADCVAALGYVHARDRFVHMDLARRAGRGRLATLGGSANVEGDAEQRHYLSTSEGEPLELAMWAKLSEETRQLLTAYTAGINAWLGHLREGAHGARLGREYDVLPDDIVAAIPDWEPADSVSIAIQLFQGNGDISYDAIYGVLLAQMGAAAFVDLFLGRPSTQVSVVPSPAPTMDASAALVPALEARATNLAPFAQSLTGAAIHRKRTQDRISLLGITQASNNWVLGPSMTASGRTIVENDPHGPLQNPPYGYVVHLDARTEGSGSLHVQGTAFTGLPVVLIGHNDHLAWGLTTIEIDATDYYQETLTEDGHGVLFEGTVVPLIEKTLTFEVAGGNPVDVDVAWVPHHGPLLARSGTSGISARWVGHAAPPDVDGLFALMRAQSAEEGVAAVRTIESFGANIVMADSDGHIGWRPAVRVPARPWASEHPPYLPLPGDGSAEWAGQLSIEEHPELFDPAEGYITTANNDLTGHWFDGDPTNDGLYLQNMVDDGDRAQRITDRLLAEAGAHTVETTLAMQSDNYIWNAAQTVPVVLEIAAGQPGPLSPNAERVVVALSGWQYTCPTGLTGNRPEDPPSDDAVLAAESIGCSAFHGLLATLTEGMLRDELSGWGYDELFSATPPSRVLFAALVRPTDLVTGETFWDDVTTAEVETRDAVVLAALDAAGGLLAGRLGSDIDDWRWGRIFTVTLRSFIDDPELTIGPYANDGGFVSVDPGAYEREGASFPQTTGAVLRMVCELSPEGVTTLLQVPGGLEHHPDSPHYDDLFEAYLANEPFEAAFTPAEVAAAAVGGWELVP